MSSRLLGLAGAALAVVLTIGAPRPAAAASSTTDGPNITLLQPYPHGYIEATLSPGQSTSTGISVANGASLPAHFLVTAVDGYTSSASGIVYGNRAVPFRDGPTGNGEYGAGRWIRVGVSDLHLNPGETQAVSITATVPVGTPAGDWVGGVTVENPIPTAANNGGTQLNITEAAGMAVIIHVPGAASAGAIFLGQPSIVAKGTQQFLEIPLRYTGDVLVKPLFSFTLTDGRGRVVASHSGRFDTFAPHTTFTYEVLLDPQVGTGTYTFDGSAGPDGNVTTLHDTVSVTAVPVPLPTQKGSAGSGASPTSGGPLSPIAWLGPALGVLLLILLLLLVRRRRSRCSHCQRGRIGALMTVADFQEIAHCRGCRQRALEREDVRLCTECYRGHVIPAPGLSVSSA